MIPVPNDYPRLEDHPHPASYFAALDRYADALDDRAIPRLFEPEDWPDWHGRRQAEGWIARLRGAIR